MNDSSLTLLQTLLSKMPKWARAVFIALIVTACGLGAFFLASCGTTSAVVRNRADNTVTEITIKTQNDQNTNITVSPNDALKINGNEK